MKLGFEIKFNSNENKEKHKKDVGESVLFYGLVFDKESDISLSYKMIQESKFSTYYIFAKALKFLADFEWFDEKVVEIVIKK